MLQLRDKGSSHPGRIDQGRIALGNGWMDGWMDVSGWSNTPARGQQDGPNVHHGLSLMSQSLIFVFNLCSRTKPFLCCMYLVKDSLKLLTVL
jgi:hypothetical protein